MDFQRVVRFVLLIYVRISLRDLLDELFPLFLSNLEDSIPSVRQGAAVALVQLYTAYGEGLLVVRSFFCLVQNQKPVILGYHGTYVKGLLVPIHFETPFK